MARHITAGIIHPVTLFNVDGSPSALLIDDLENALVTIDFPHHEIHEGVHYEASYKSPEGGDIADNNNLDILIVTGAQVAHTVGTASAGGDAELFFYEGTTTTDDGTAATVANLNRTSGNTPVTEVLYAPTVSGAGTLLLNFFMPGGTGPQSAGGSAQHDVEWILKESTKYLIRVTNRAGTAQPVGVVVQWYEP